jgi:periplasmic protein TonB
MPPSAKEFDVIAATSATPAARPAASGARPDDAAGRPQPVALEVPVSVNGARTVEGSDKREPFSESTVTVLVFANGAVIRLASTVVAGQLLFLTNEKTKKEVVCQVVKSKNYSNVSGYVELEFTEAVSGFWGMRFPGERGAAPPAASAPAATAAPIAPPAAAPKVPTPAASSAPKPVPVASKPAPPPPVVMKPAQTSASQANAPVTLPRAAETKPITALPKPVAPPIPVGTTTTTSLPRAAEVKPATLSVTIAPAPNASPASTDALKRESARLQEQLSSLLFTPDAPAPPAAPKAGSPAKNAPLKMESTLDVEEVKIPSWLEPLARNAATTPPEAVAAEEPLQIDLDKAQEFELADWSTASIAQEVQTAAPTEPIFAGAVLGEDTFEPKAASAGSNKGILIGAIAAGLVVAAAGGAWFLRQPTNPVPGAATAATAPATAANSALQPQPQPQQRSAAVQTAPSASLAPATPQAAGPASSQANAQPAASLTQVKTSSSNSSNTNTTEALLAYKQLAEPQPKPELKKPSLGQVRLATPTNRGAPRVTGEAEPSLALNESQVTPNSDAFGGGLLSGNTKQPVAPAAPLPVGGDVKPAHMLSSISPIYPALAKSQHIDGDVRLDALVGADGRVSTMKVVSGPTLLHQAAMDALRQWKYQPATLDGKTVPMHLTVTIQFRLQ